jgi:hypothetical protein
MIRADFNYCGAMLLGQAEQRHRNADVSSSVPFVARQGPSWLKIAATISLVVVFPLLPATPTTG